jgi:hypothetical protein
VLDVNNVPWKKRLLIATPTEGWIRYEWAHTRFGQVMPVNWEGSGFDLDYVAAGYSIDDAYNVICRQAVQLGVEWLLTIEDDVLPPLDTFIKLNEYVNKGDVPIVSGLYYHKGFPPEPLVFRGRGNGVFKDWKQGQKVWCDGLPMGLLLVHMSIIRWFWDNCEEYVLPNGDKAKMIFITPRKVEFDMKHLSYKIQQGTQDLYFFDRILELGVLGKTGWKKYAKKKYPFLCDTSIFCRHIDRQTGKQYP